ncbi:MAG: Fe-S cluster assembly protein HesB, partial [Candidatus Thorarchaeota archaeon]|nr:Fe-S cluster assembly protein HesB [Candidatus Thorarchaeota archaeon]
LKNLAEANAKHLLKVWSGLGYNRRTVWLREAAQSIVDKGSFPTTVEELRKLKGIGPYTSRSILIFAFNQNIAAVDTNIRRVFIASGFTTEDASDKDLQDIANTLLLGERSRDWHNALMDYGSEVLSSSSTGISPKSQQPKFEGSIRQVRGQIIRILAEYVSLSKEDLCSKLDSENVKHIDIDKVLNQLAEDRLIEFSTTGEIKISE